jgi:hypothetical protein
LRNIDRAGRFLGVSHDEKSEKSAEQNDERAERVSELRKSEKLSVPRNQSGGSNRLGSGNGFNFRFGTERNRICQNRSAPVAFGEMRRVFRLQSFGQNVLGKSGNLVGIYMNGFRIDIGKRGFAFRRSAKQRVYFFVEFKFPLNTF